MRTYISPIGYDTRRVTQPALSSGLDTDDQMFLLRPDTDTGSERAQQAIADVEQLLQNIAPGVRIEIQHVSVASLKTTVRDCCAIIDRVADTEELLVSLGGGARDLLLPLTISAIVRADDIDQTLFYSDLNSEVREWTLPRLTTQLPQRALGTLDLIMQGDEWQTLSALAAQSEHSKSTVIRHVNDLADAELVETKSVEQVKHVRGSFTGRLLWQA